MNIWDALREQVDQHSSRLDVAEGEILALRAVARDLQAQQDRTIAKVLEGQLEDRLHRSRIESKLDSLRELIEALVGRTRITVVPE